MTLRNLPNLDDAFAGELGRPRPADMAALLDQFWPECFESTSTGCAVLKPEDARRPEALFTLFGVALKVGEHSLDTVGRAYDVLAPRLGPVVTWRLTVPRTYESLTRDWPQEWRDYIEAVARQDQPLAQMFAQKLRPLSPDCVLPPDV